MKLIAHKIIQKNTQQNTTKEYKVKKIINENKNNFEQNIMTKSLFETKL